MRLLLIAVVSRLPSCSWESGGAVTVAMNMTGFTSPCATDSNSAETLRSHIAERPAPWLWLRSLLAKSQSRLQKHVSSNMEKSGAEGAAEDLVTDLPNRWSLNFATTSWIQVERGSEASDLRGPPCGLQ